MTTRTVTFDPIRLIARYCNQGMTDREIAEELGVSIRTVQGWRSGRQRLTRTRADELAIGLGLHPVLLWPEWGAL